MTVAEADVTRVATCAGVALLTLGTVVTSQHNSPDQPRNALGPITQFYWALITRD